MTRSRFISPAFVPARWVAVCLAAAATAVGTAAAVGPEASSVVARIDTGSKPCGVLFAAGSVWVTNFGDASLVRIDPATNAVVARIPVDAQPCGLAFGNGSLWIETGSRVVDRVDVTANRVAARVRTGGDSYDVQVGGGSVWVTNRLPATVTRVDPKRNRVTKTIKLAGAHPTGVAVAGRFVWVGDEQGAALLRIDPRTNRVGRIASSQLGPAWFALSAGKLWVTNAVSRTASRVNTTTGKLSARVPVGTTPVDPDFVGGDLWVPNLGDGTLTRVDTVAARTVETVAVGGQPIVVAAGGGDVWVTDFAGSGVVRSTLRNGGGEADDAESRTQPGRRGDGDGVLGGGLHDAPPRQARPHRDQHDGEARREQDHVADREDVRERHPARRDPAVDEQREVRVGHEPRCSRATPCTPVAAAACGSAGMCPPFARIAARLHAMPSPTKPMPWMCPFAEGRRDQQCVGADPEERRDGVAGVPGQRPRRERGHLRGQRDDDQPTSRGSAARPVGTDAAAERRADDHARAGLRGRGSRDAARERGRGRSGRVERALERVDDRRVELRPREAPQLLERLRDRAAGR